MDKIVFLVTPYVGCVLLFLLVRQILPGKVGILGMVLSLLPVMLAHVPKCIWGSDSTAAQTISLCSALLIYTIYPLAFFQGAKWKRIFVSVFFFAVQMLAETVCFVIFVPHFGASFERYPLVQAVAYSAVSLCIFALIGMLVVLLFRMVSLRDFKLFYFLLLVFPVSQFMMLFYIIYRNYSPLWLLCSVILGLVAEVMLLGYTITREKKAALTRELDEVKHLLALERVYYREIEERQEKLAQIRHDFNNQLSVIEQLVKSGACDDAEKMIQSLERDINNDSRGEDAYA